MACLRNITIAAALATVGSAGSADSSASERFNRPEDVQAISRMEMDVQLFGNVDELMRVVWRHVSSVGSSNDVWQSGWENAYDSLAKEYATVSGGAHKPTVQQRYGWIRQFNMATDGQLACVAMHLRIPFVKHGQPTSVAFPEMDVWRKFGNSWLAVQLHTYFPIDPKTGQAMPAYDLPDRGAMQWSGNPLPGPAADPARAEAELRDWLVRRTTSTDPDALMQLFGPTDDVMAFGPQIPAERRGLGEIRQYLGTSLAGVRAISARITDFSFQSDGLMGTLLARQTVTYTMNDGATRTIILRHSNCLRRDGNGWRSMIEMVSQPSNTSSPLG